MKRNMLLAQSGGPTAVINASIIGAFDAAKKSNKVDKIFAACGGIEGILNENLIELTAIDDNQLRLLRSTPSAGLCSCRHNMPQDESNPQYKRIFDVLEAHNIGYFLYNGGNDSMDTAFKLDRYSKNNGCNVLVNGIPKTIDNDLFGTDHCPGFGSAAKMLNVTLQEAAYDTFSYPNSKTVIIMETMGRNAGWLAASTALAEYDSRQIADLIYLPERAFSLDSFLSDIDSLLKKQTMVFAVVSEGVKSADGKPVFSSGTNTQDTFGHQQLGGLSAILVHEVKKNILKRAKYINPNISQRCASHIMSKTDFDEAYSAGAKAVEFLFGGISGIMSSFKRVSNHPYEISIEPAPLKNAANKEQLVPDEMISESGNNVTEKMKEYALPLIMGEVAIPYANGLPAYTKINPVFAAKKLPRFDL